MKKITDGFTAGFGYLAYLAQLAAFLWYGSDMLVGAVETNPVSWGLWFLETFVGLLIYVDRTQDPPKWIGEAMAMFGVVCVTGYLVAQAMTGHWTEIVAPVEPVDAIPTIFAIVVFIFWLRTREKYGAGPSTWLFQLPLILAAVPLIRATGADPSAEPLGPWAVWTAGFVCQLICATLRWDGWAPLLNPLNYAITHAIVALIVWHGAALW